MHRTRTSLWHRPSDWFHWACSRKTTPDSIPRFKEVFGELAQFAADKGVRLALKIARWRHLENWRLEYRASPKAWELMFDAVDAENVGSNGSQRANYIC